MSIVYRAHLVYGVTVPPDAFDGDDEIEDAVEGTRISYLHMTDLDGHGDTVLAAVEYEVTSEQPERFGVWHVVETAPETLAQWNRELAGVAQGLGFSAMPGWLMGMGCG